MTIEGRIEEATCRVDVDNQQAGSAFWVSDDKLVTAAHVVDSAPSNSVTVQTNEGAQISCDVEHSDPHSDDDPGTDLALLEPESHSQSINPLSVTADIPEIGSEVVWSGYARLFGEPQIDRQRFGWGKIASSVYGEDDAEFFEVDGLFNPSHSGGPVVSTDSEEVVGVVSASAGGFGNLEDAWETRAELVEGALDMYEMATGSSGFRNTASTQDPTDGVAIQQLFDRIGVEYDTSITDDGQIDIQFYRAEIPGRVGVILSEMAHLLLETAQSTFQMGVGITTGGQPLSELVE